MLLLALPPPQTRLVSSALVSCAGRVSSPSPSSSSPCKHLLAAHALQQGHGGTKTAEHTVRIPPCLARCQTRGPRSTLCRMQNDHVCLCGLPVCLASSLSVAALLLFLLPRQGSLSLGFPGAVEPRVAICRAFAGEGRGSVLMSMSMSMSCLTGTPWQQEPIQGNRPIEEIRLPSFDAIEGAPPLCSVLLSSADCSAPSAVSCNAPSPTHIHISAVTAAHSLLFFSPPTHTSL